MIISFIIVPLFEQLPLLLNYQNLPCLLLQTAMNLIASRPWNTDLHNGWILMIAKPIHIGFGKATAVVLENFFLFLFFLHKN
jgi:hypothetical protein